MAATKKLSQMTAAQRKKRIALLAANPATRKAIPDEYLPAQYRAKRAQAVAAKAPLVPGGQTTRGEFLSQRKRAADVEFGPAQKQLTTQQQQVPGWFDSYLRELQSIQQQVQANYGAARQGVEGTAASSAATAPGQQGDAQAVQAGQSRKALLDAFASSIAAQGAGAGAHLGNMQAAAGQQKITTQQKISDQLKELESQRGQFYNEYEAKSKDAERKAILEDAMFGITEAKAAVDAKAKADAAARARGKARRDAERLRLERERARAKAKADAAKDKRAQNKVLTEGVYAGYTQAQVDAMSTEQRRRIAAEAKKKSKGSSKTSPRGAEWQTAGQIQGFWKDVEKAEAFARHLMSKKKRSRPEMLGRILREPNNPGRLAVAVALDKVYQPGGRLTAITVRRLHANGIKVTAGGVRT